MTDRLHSLLLVLVLLMVGLRSLLGLRDSVLSIFTRSDSTSSLDSSKVVRRTKHVSERRNYRLPDAYCPSSRPIVSSSLRPSCR
ncbi:hypothetical protein ASPSYDRAFT_45145 [Aspergillus sydowii CBS 593.65]|uniref:Secreted protein n=1 Tax=Aspergillus sydowii CBS 593.65 TaxID=1036612 RepID=A0A1L9TH87_9EURO|nr:uncharacterized protein ASPSYDRAFT_45145 [Aspergillus sydowii CBS 593.65]OJJ58751.1 hypothetical protein ASPSYDRAFT_45145 [Aspergillus sydowii CBS 593.65]